MNYPTNLRNNLIVFFGTFVLLIAFALSACQAELVVEPAISLEGLSPEKQGYVQRGLIELVPDDLPNPVVPEEPVQADLGMEPYYQICLACHGNWGQGLTDEWRAVGFLEDQDCWQSKCHASNHPPQGFEFPKKVPPLLGKGAMPEIANAKELHQVISETMPWWFPGSLSAGEAINLTAYIMRARGELPEGVVLTEENLEAFPLHVPAPEIVDEKTGAIILIAGLAVTLLIFIIPVRRFSEPREDS